MLLVVGRYISRWPGKHVCLHQSQSRECDATPLVGHLVANAQRQTWAPVLVTHCVLRKHVQQQFVHHAPAGCRLSLTFHHQPPDLCTHARQKSWRPHRAESTLPLILAVGHDGPRAFCKAACIDASPHCTPAPLLEPVGCGMYAPPTMQAPAAHGLRSSRAGT